MLRVGTVLAFPSPGLVLVFILSALGARQGYCSKPAQLLLLTALHSLSFQVIVATAISGSFDMPDKYGMPIVGKISMG